MPSQKQYDFMFARNPIIIRGAFPAGAFEANGGRIGVEIGGEHVFSGTFAIPLKINISEVIDSIVTGYSEVTPDGINPILEVMGPAELDEWEVRVVSEYDGYVLEDFFTALPGGVSKQNYRRYISGGTDAITGRFLNPAGNFFLTTRTAGWRLLMRETELCPLYFLATETGTIKAVELMTDKSMMFDLDGAGVHALDVDTLRLRFMEQYDIIPSVFDIFRDGIFSCRLVICRADDAPERYRLKFRNSLGVYEIIDMPGELYVADSFDDTDDSQFNRYDSVTDDLTTDRGRIACSRTLELETGFMRPDEIAFMLDMVASESVYLLDMSPLPLKVIPSVDDVERKHRPTEPQKFKLKLEIVDDETQIMPDIVTANDSHKPRVFSRQFSKQFN